VSDRFDTPAWGTTEDDGAPAEPPETPQLPATSVSEDTVLYTPSDAEGMLDHAAENVLEGWPAPLATEEATEGPALDGAEPPADPALLVHAEHSDPAGFEADLSTEHAPGELVVPPGFAVLEGFARGERRAVGVVVARFNGEVTSRLLASALEELEARGVATDAVTVMPVPGAFELPLAAMALAKTRRFACIVALGCVIRGDTPHFDYVCAEAASGLQLAAIETGVPVAFGLLTLDRADQAEHRIDKGAEAVRTGLEMADLFASLRAAAAR
jgi:6,7-dimethyl-8-ribityllumazine synthase